MFQIKVIKVSVTVINHHFKDKMQCLHMLLQRSTQMSRMKNIFMRKYYHQSFTADEEMNICLNSIQTKR